MHSVRAVEARWAPVAASSLSRGWSPPCRPRLQPRGRACATQRWSVEKAGERANYAQSWWGGLWRKYEHVHRLN